MRASAQKDDDGSIRLAYDEDSFLPRCALHQAAASERPGQFDFDWHYMAGTQPRDLEADNPRAQCPIRQERDRHRDKYRRTHREHRDPTPGHHFRIPQSPSRTSTGRSGLQQWRSGRPKPIPQATAWTDAAKGMRDPDAVTRSQSKVTESSRHGSEAVMIGAWTKRCPARNSGGMA